MGFDHSFEFHVESERATEAGHFRQFQGKWSVSRDIPYPLAARLFAN